MSGESILLVEDNDAVALGLQIGLERERYQVTRAASVAEARSLAREVDFHLFVLDIRLPDGSGFDLCRDLRASGLRQPILILTARDETSDKVIGLELGADDYMTKPFELHELIARIRALLRRSYGSLADGEPSLVEAGDISLDFVKQRVFCRGLELHVTATEFRLLAFLIQHPGRAFDRATLIRRVWSDEQLAGDNRTVDVHIRNLRTKIEIDPAWPRLIVTVRGAGYMFAG
ncbi:MAG: response regulator transcription factor [Chloroflexota bacterium]|nr:MAG: response regulator transcription factor [Chloroflexota bacterium]